MELLQAMEPALSPDVVDALLDVLAERIAQRLLAVAAAPATTTPETLTWSTARVAQEIGMSEQWVREHRDELGVRPADGIRPRLLFDPDRVREWAKACPPSNPSQGLKAPSTLADRREGQRRAGTAAPLLPIAPARKAA